MDRNHYFSLLLIFLLTCFSSRLSGQNLSISLDVEDKQLMPPVLENALEDARDLLRIACNCPVNQDDPGAQVQLKIMSPRYPADAEPIDFSKNRPYPYFMLPDHQYAWKSESKGPHILLTLKSPSYEGLANGLYGLLQEKLGFYFVHPRETVHPCFQTWPLPSSFDFQGIPRFDKKGFHLHTQHPTELTEALHNHNSADGQDMIQEYILWLARNQQNFFEFCLLETVALENWIPYAKEFVHYAHDRGILCSVDLSLHMVQQHAFKLVEFPPKNFTRYEKQIDRRLDLILSAGFDFINMEFSIAEFIGGFEKLRNRLREYIVQKISTYPGVKLIGRTHVVKAEDEFGGKKKGKGKTTDDPDRGNLIHTVMCYSLTDSSAPVYELDNFSHLKALLASENKVRETWYYPESAYWITFDNSIPLFLLPYLSARYRDVQTVQQMGIPGHVTFSSGWEWGYWLVDWSIARWSWEYRENGVVKGQSPLMGVEDLFPGREIQNRFLNLLEIENHYLIKRNTLRLLCPHSFSDGLPKGLNKQFQPRTEIYQEDLAKSPGEAADSIVLAWIEELNRLFNALKPHAEALNTIPQVVPGYQYEGRRELLLRELYLSCAVFVNYIEHRNHTFKAFLKGMSTKGRQLSPHLENAEAVRIRSLAMVEEMESKYRYPVSLIAREHKSYTSYPYGYLFPVSDLHFWQRHEEQLWRWEFNNPFMMNIYDPARIAGFKR